MKLLPRPGETEELAIEAEITATKAELLEEAPELPTVPSAALVVKLERPAAAMTLAALRPSALNGVLRELTSLAFSTSEPTTEASTRGTTPRSSAVTGKEVSIFGMQSFF